MIFRRIGNVPPLLIPFFVPQGEARHLLVAFVHDKRVMHTERIEDGFFQELGIALASDSLDDLAKDDVARIAVFELFAGRKA